MSKRVELPSIHEMFPEHLFQQQSQLTRDPSRPATPSQLHRDAPPPITFSPSPHARNHSLPPLHIPALRDVSASRLADIPLSRRRHTVTQISAGTNNEPTRHAAGNGSGRLRSPSLPEVGSHFYQQQYSYPTGMTAGTTTLLPSLTAYRSAPPAAHRFPPPRAYPSHYASHGLTTTSPELSDYESSSIHSSDTDAEGEVVVTPVAPRIEYVGEPRMHGCDLCGRRFDRPSSLRTHYNTHTGNQPYACPYPSCTRSFSVKSNMRRHYRNHFTPLPEERPGQIKGSRVFRLDRWQGGAMPGPHPPESTLQSSFTVQPTPPQPGPSPT